MRCIRYQSSPIKVIEILPVEEGLYGEVLWGPVNGRLFGSVQYLLSLGMSHGGRSSGNVS